MQNNNQRLYEDMILIDDDKSLLLFIHQASIFIEDTMVIRVEGFRDLLSREDLQWVSRVC